MSEQKNSRSWMPFVFGIALALGIYIGDRLNSKHELNGANKMDEVLNYIQSNYVDTLNLDETQDKAIESLLHQLDPHSTYIPASDLKEVNEDLDGNFEGIGVEFRILNDTVVVLNVIDNGPSEKAGLHDGDRIVKVNSKNIAGIKITNKEVMKLLKGEGGTKVNVTVFRKAVGKSLTYDITRGEIPIYSITTSYMYNANIGYILIDRFAATTHDEFVAAAEKLKRAGMKKLIIDVRNNPGGYLETAVDVIDEMIAGEKLVVYTQGNNRKRQKYTTSKNGLLEDVEIAVLINESSASAAEILAGALQDWDRAMIIGRRSFGKGLVQEQTPISDGSAIRLTVARYYIPSGRCIQKSYANGNDKYAEDILDREYSGELFSKDSIKLDKSKEYKTAGGKIVYGGGGITPDYFVPLDTSHSSNYLSKLYSLNSFSEFCYDYADNNIASLKSYKNANDFAANYVVNDNLLNGFTKFATSHGVPFDQYGFDKSKQEIKNQLKSFMARIAWNDEGLYRSLNDNDPTFKKAVELLR
ncbi:MAG: S41 family peptidase [Bacteroidota bacterium]